MENHRLTGFTDAADFMASPLSTLGKVGQFVALWPQAVGPEIARVTSPTGIRDTTLRIRCDSSVWASELMMLQTELLPRINAAFQLAEPITQIKTWNGPPAQQKMTQGEAAQPETLPPLADLSPEELAKIEQMVSAIPAGPLRDQVARAAIASAQRRNSH